MEKIYDFFAVAFYVALFIGFGLVGAMLGGLVGFGFGLVFAVMIIGDMADSRRDFKALEKSRQDYIRATPNWSCPCPKNGPCLVGLGWCKN